MSGGARIRCMLFVLKYVLKWCYCLVNSLLSFIINYCPLQSFQLYENVNGPNSVLVINWNSTMSRPENTKTSHVLSLSGSEPVTIGGSHAKIPKNNPSLVQWDHKEIPWNESYCKGTEKPTVLLCALIKWLSAKLSYLLVSQNSF